MKNSKKPRTGRSQTTLRPLNNRSRITNGRALLPGIHSQSVWARRFYDLLSLHLSDLGGEDNCSEAEKALVRRSSFLILELEHMEMKFALAEDGASPDQLRIYQMATNTLRRTLESLGLKRRAKDITPPDLAQYLRTKHRDAAEDAQVEAEA